jgi:integrase
MRLYYIIKENKSTKECYVILKYKYKSKQVDLTPSLKVKKSNFGDGKSDNPIKRTDTEFLRKNEVLRGFKERINQIIYNLNSEGVEPSCEMVKNQFKKKEKENYFESKIPTQSTSLLVLFVIEKYLVHVENTSKSKYKVGVKEDTPYSKSVKSRFVHIKDLIKTKYGSDFDFYEIGDEFYDNLQSYLINKDLSNVTISKIISQFRQFVRWSQKNNYTKGGDTSYKVTLPTNYKTIITLNEDEITKLFKFRGFDYTLKNGKVNTKVLDYYKNWKEKDYTITEDVRKTVFDKKGMIKGDEPTGKVNLYTTYEVLLDMFLFGISTGLRWSNLVTIRGINYDYDTKKFTPIQLKTKRRVEIIENELSRFIWMKYVKGKSSNQYVFPLPTSENDNSRRMYNTKGNVHIKNIGKILGLTRRVEVVKMSGETSSETKVPLYTNISFHMGRKTHSTIGSHQGVDPYSISKQMGHSGMDMTSRYVGRDEDKLEKMFDFIEEDLKDVKKTVHKIESKEIKKGLSSKDIDKKLEELKSRYDRKLITKKVYEEKMKELI